VSDLKHFIRDFALFVKLALYDDQATITKSVRIETHLVWGT